MKKMLMIGAALVAMSASSFALTISGQCGSTATGALVNSIGSTDFVCPAFSTLATPSGSTVGTLTLFVGLDYGWSSPVSSPTINTNATFTLPAGFSPAGPLTLTRNGTGSTNSLSGTSTSVLSSVVAGNTYTVTGSAASTATTPDTLSISVFYSYDYSVPTNNAIPEPSSMALMGGALVGIGALLRRRK